MSDRAEPTQPNLNLDKPILVHNVKNFVREVVGIPEYEPVALVVHITSKDNIENIRKNGFVNISGRGTLAPITDNPHPDEDVGVPSIAMSKTEQGEMSLITFCLPARYLKGDPEKKYGLWFDLPLPPDKSELRSIYDNIVVEYDPVTGKPLKYAKDLKGVYPVYIPPEYIYDIVTETKRG